MEHRVSVEYRIYPLDERGRIEGSVDVVCADDQQAIALAQRVGATGLQVEVWATRRLVGRFPTVAQQLDR